MVATSEPDWFYPSVDAALLRYFELRLTFAASTRSLPMNHDELVQRSMAGAEPMSRIELCDLGLLLKRAITEVERELLFIEYAGQKIAVDDDAPVGPQDKLEAVRRLCGMSINAYTYDQMVSMARGKVRRRLEVLGWVPISIRGPSREVPIKIRSRRYTRRYRQRRCVRLVRSRSTCEPGVRKPSSGGRPQGHSRTGGQSVMVPGNIDPRERPLMNG